MSDLIQYDQQDKTAIIKLDNGKANAISPELIEQFNACLDKAEEQQATVITTGHPGMLSGGYDLAVMTKSAESAMSLVDKGSKLSHRLLSFPTPVITACSGHAIAKGAFLLLSSDWRIGAEGPFKIGLNEVLIGITLHHVGITLARERLNKAYFDRSVINAEIYDPQGAMAAGFLDSVVAEEELMPQALAAAEQMAKLNAKAFTETKLKARADFLERLAKAIELDQQTPLF